MSLPWSVLSWFWLGSAVPDTMVIKLGESMGDRTFANGLYYFFEAYPFAVTASLIPPALGVLVLLGGWRRAVAPLHLVLGVGGLLHAGTYLLLNTAPYQWYYGPAIGALTMLGAVGAQRAALRTGDAGGRRWRRWRSPRCTSSPAPGRSRRSPATGPRPPSTARWPSARPPGRWCSRSARWARWPTTAPAR